MDSQPQNLPKLGPRQLKLVEALESGEYTQIRHWLKKRGCFCVIGVAYEISGLGEWESLSGGSAHIYKFEDGSEALLGVKEPLAEYYKLDPDDLLMHQNDTEGKTFKEIAAEIREYPQSYFTEAA